MGVEAEERGWQALNDIAKNEIAIDRNQVLESTIESLIDEKSDNSRIILETSFIGSVKKRPTARFRRGAIK